MEGMHNETLKDIWRRIDDGNLLLIDTRTVKEYFNSHIPGSLSAPYSRYSWGRSVAQYLSGSTSGVALLAQNGTIADEAAGELKDNGIEVVRVIPNGMESWISESLPVSKLKEITTEELHEQLGDYTVIDVREPYEWNSGVIEGAEKIPLGDLPSNLPKLAKDRKYALVCAHGNRSQSAALYLADNGFDAESVLGGMADWLSKEYPVNYE